MTTAEDIRLAAQLCREALEAHLDADWERPAGHLDWTARQTLEHLVEGLGFYARDLATPVLAFPEHEVSLVVDPGCEPVGVLDGIGQTAAVVAAVVTATPPHVRALHPFGLADAPGFAAMACDELLVHTADICTGFGVPFTPPADLCARVVARLFPWAPRDADPWQVLLWANGRTALPGRPRLGPRWRWHAAPLDEAVATVRPETAADREAVRALHRAAFDTAEEADLVDALRDTDAWAASLVAVVGGEVVGHVLLTRVEVGTGQALALAPIAVHPDHQRAGVGWLLMWGAIDAAERSGASLVVLLGHDRYYPRFGFVPADPLGVTCPFDAPPEAWMALVLAENHPRGEVRYPAPFGAF